MSRMGVFFGGFRGNLVQVLDWQSNNRWLTCWVMGLWVLTVLYEWFEQYRVRANVYSHVCQSDIKIGVHDP